MIKIYKSIVDGIFEQALENYPFECCGLLSSKTIDSVIDNSYPTKNSLIETNIAKSRRRFEMDSKDQISALKEIQQNELTLSGIYHSHPHSKSYFSSKDKELALIFGAPPYPNASYIVVSVKDNIIGEINSFKYDEPSKDFIEETIEIIK